MAGFDNFKTFVHHSSGVNSDLGAHLPSRMPQSLSRCYSSQLFFTAVAERTAGSSQENPFKLPVGVSTEALPDSRVLAIYRQDFYRRRRASSMTISLPATSVSLLARAISLPASSAARTGLRPAKPTTAAKTRSVSQGGSCLQSAVAGQNLRLIGSFQLEFVTQNIS